MWTHRVERLLFGGTGLSGAVLYRVRGVDAVKIQTRSATRVGMAVGERGRPAVEGLEGGVRRRELRIRRDAAWCVYLSIPSTVYATHHSLDVLRVSARWVLFGRKNTLPALVVLQF